jgi:hypothetical protein
VQKPGAGEEVIAGAPVHRSFCAIENFDDSIKKNKKAVPRKLFLGRMNIFIVDLLWLFIDWMTNKIRVSNQNLQ